MVIRASAPAARASERYDSICALSRLALPILASSSATHFCPRVLSTSIRPCGRSAPFLPVAPTSVHAFSRLFFPSGAPCAWSRLFASSGTCSMQARRIETARFSFDPSESAGNSAARWPLAS